MVEGIFITLAKVLVEFLSVSFSLSLSASLCQNPVYCPLLSISLAAVTSPPSPHHWWVSLHETNLPLHLDRELIMQKDHKVCSIESESLKVEPHFRGNDALWSSQYVVCDPMLTDQIGRASCRERV